MIEDVDDVVLASENANAIRRAVRDWCEQQGLGPYDRDERFGFLRNLVVREGRRTGETLVRLVTTTNEPQPERLRHAPGSSTMLGALENPPANIVWSRSDDPGNATRDTKDKVLPASRSSRRRSSACAFASVRTRSSRPTPSRPRSSTSTAIEFAGLTGRELVFDLYCGSGTIGIAMAEHAKQVWGVELVQDAVEDAAVNANLNGVTNADFLAGDMRLALPQLIEHAGTPDVVVLDPPRAGLSAKVVRRVMEAAPKRIVYVSCNPDTLAPNLKQMVESGYALRRVRPVDMFPHTPHIECVSVLDLVDDAKRVAVIEARVEERRAKQSSRLA